MLIVQTDETVWEPIEVRDWPEEWLPPTDVVLYHVVSGNHRTSAAQIKGLKTLRARVIEAPATLDYLQAAIRTNARHGRNFTEDDRKVLAVKLKGLGQSADQIAALFSVNRATVYNWLSGRDSNSSKKKAKEQQAEGMRLLAAAEATIVDEDWASLPETSVDERVLLQTRSDIIDFLRTPAILDKAHVIHLLRTLEIEDIEPLLADMQVARQWLQNVTSLLAIQSGRKSGSGRS